MESNLPDSHSVVSTVLWLHYKEYMGKINLGNAGIYHLPAQVPDSSSLTPLDVILTGTFYRGLSAISSLIRCNHISSQPCYIKHYFWQSGIFFPFLSPSFFPLSLNMRNSSSLIFSLSFPNKPPSQLHWTFNRSLNSIRISIGRWFLSGNRGPITRWSIQSPV